MKTLAFVSLLFLTFCCIPALAQEQQVIVPYTLADRDRTIRTEAKMEAIEAKMDVKFDNIQKQIDQLNTLFYWGFGILTHFAAHFIKDHKRMVKRNDLLTNLVVYIF